METLTHTKQMRPPLSCRSFLQLNNTHTHNNPSKWSRAAGCLTRCRCKGSRSIELLQEVNFLVSIPQQTTAERNSRSHAELTLLLNQPHQPAVWRNRKPYIYNVSAARLGHIKGRCKPQVRDGETCLESQTAASGCQVLSVSRGLKLWLLGYLWHDGSRHGYPRRYLCWHGITNHRWQWENMDDLIKIMF